MFAREYTTVPLHSPVIGFLSCANTRMCDGSINRGTERIPNNGKSPASASRKPPFFRPNYKFHEYHLVSTQIWLHPSRLTLTLGRSMLWSLPLVETPVLRTHDHFSLPEPSLTEG